MEYLFCCVSTRTATIFYDAFIPNSLKIVLFDNNIGLNKVYDQFNDVY